VTEKIVIKESPSKDSYSYKSSKKDDGGHLKKENSGERRKSKYESTKYSTSTYTSKYSSDKYSKKD